jgi:hypothetical protein
MLCQYGAMETANGLLRPSEDPQYGLFRLAECGGLDLSIEAIALKPEYLGLFSAAELPEARQRLKRLGYPRAFSTDQDCASWLLRLDEVALAGAGHGEYRHVGVLQAGVERVDDHW